MNCEDQRFEQWLDERVLYIIKLEERHARGESAESTIIFMTGSCGRPVNEPYNEVFNALSPECKREVVQRSLRRLTESYAIECTRFGPVTQGNPHSSLPYIKAGWQFEHFYASLDVLDAIVKATTTPTLLSLDPSKFS